MSIDGGVFMQIRISTRYDRRRDEHKRRSGSFFFFFFFFSLIRFDFSVKFSTNYKHLHCVERETNTKNKEIYTFLLNFKFSNLKNTPEIKIQLLKCCVTR